MENQITNKIDALKSKAVSQNEFMKQLAQLDEQGEGNAELLEQVNGGIDVKALAIMQAPAPLGLWVPTFPEEIFLVK